MRFALPLRSVLQALSVVLLLTVGQASAADVTRLVEDLASDDGSKRREAAYDLHQLGSEAVDALPALIQALDDDEDQVFFHAVSAIARIGPAADAAIPALIQRLGPVKRRYGEQINLRAAFALSRIGGAAVDPLILALKEPDATACANAIAALAQMPAEVSAPAMDTLIGLLGDEREPVSANVCKALSNFGETAVPAINVALVSGNEAQQRDAIRTLGMIGIPAGDSAPRIAEIANANSSAPLLVAALEALVRLRHDPAETTQIVVSALRSTDETIANAAADAALLLGQVHPELDAAPFAQAFPSADKPVQLRFAAVLGRMGEVAAPAIPALVEAAESSPDATEQLAFAQALSGIGPAATPLLLDSAGRLPLSAITEKTWSLIALGRIGAPALSALRQGLQSGNPSRRKAAVIALGLLGSDAAPAIDALFSLLDDPEAQIRGSALVALPRAGVASERMLPLLVSLTADASARVRTQAFRAMGSITDNRERLLPLLIEGINDPSAEVQAGAMQAAGALGADAAATVPAIKTVLESPNDGEIGKQRERAAISALGKIGAAAKPAVAALAARLSNGPPDIQILTLISLGSIGHEASEALPTIRTSLEASEPEVRAKAYEAVAKIETNPQTLTDTLVLGLEDESPAVRSTAVERLGASGEDARAAAPKLFGLLSRTDDPQPIIEALRNIRTRDYELYVTALRSASPSVRLFACESLGRFGSRASSALPELEKLQDDEYDFVRRRASQAIERIKRQRR